MKLITGTVVFAKMSKTAAVEVKFLQMNLLYKKRVWKKTKYLVHNEKGAVVGDKVIFVECKPISKKVHWTITEVITSAAKQSRTTCLAARRGSPRLPSRDDNEKDVIAAKTNVIARNVVTKQSKTKKAARKVVKK